MIQDTVDTGKPAEKVSVFKGHENLRVLSIFFLFIIVIVVLQLIVFGTGVFPTFISPVNILNMLQQVSAPGIVAVGMTFVMISGGIDLSVGMMASLVAIIIAMGFSVWHFGIIPSILLGIGAAVALETFMGYLISRTKVEPFIITLGGMILCQGIALLISNSQEIDIANQLNFLTVNLINGAIDPLTGLHMIFQPYVIVFLLILLIGGLVLVFTKYGRRVYAVGANQQAAYLAGINVKNIKFSTYIITGVLVGISAIVLLGRVDTGIITLGQGMEISTIAMVVIGGTALAGGKGNMGGTLIGILFLGSIGNAMALLRLPPEVQYVTRGLVIIIAVSVGDISSKISEYFGRKRGARRQHAAVAQQTKGGDV